MGRLSTICGQLGPLLRTICFELGFLYASAQAFMKLAFDPIWPWPLMILTVLAMLAVVAAGYPRRVRHLPKSWQRSLLAIRLLAVLLLSLWLLRPAVILETDDHSNAVLYVVMDASGSMETPDAVGSTTRRKAMLELYEQAAPLFEDLSESVEVRIRDLAEDLTPTEQPAAVADGKMTLIGANLENLAQEANREKIAAILFWGDGKQAALGADDVDPIQAARMLGRQHRPIYSVCYGSSEVAATTLDLSLTDLDVPRDVFEGNVVPVKVRLRAFGAAGREMQLRVLVEDRAGLPNGTSGQMKPVPMDKDNITVKSITADNSAFDATVDLQFVPSGIGEIKVAVEVTPLADEVRKTNNRVETVIKVRSGGIRIAYFDRIRPEFKWLRRINISNRVQLDAQPVRGGAFADRNEFNDSWFEPGNYDAFIIGDVPADFFGDQRLRQLVRCCEQGAGLMMIGGQTSFGAGGYQKTPLARLLPIEMSDSDDQLTAAVPMLPTSAALNNPILQIAPPEVNRSRWAELPPLQGANMFRLKQGTAAQVLAESDTRVPLLIGQNTGSARILVFAGDTTWQWALQEEWAVEAHQRFWRQVIFWLTRMEIDGESPAWISVEPRDVAPGSSVELAFGLRDSDGMPMANVNYDVNVQQPEQTDEKAVVRSEGGHGAATYQNTLVPGDYWVSVAAEGDDATMNYASTRFLVNERDPELDNPAADPALMRELAHVSGGDYLEPDGMIARLEEWVTHGMPSLELKRTRRVTLWDNWYSLLLFIGLLTAEWFFRKKRSLA